MKHIDLLTLRDMKLYPNLYGGLADGLIELPCPDKIKIGRKSYPIPDTLEKFSNNICYGQRLYLCRKEENDIDLCVRLVLGYYYPEITGRKWNEDKTLLIREKIVTCKAKEIYPTTVMLTNLIKDVAAREQELLNRKPSKVELAAGIEKLDPFSELNALDFLRDTMKITIEEVLLTPYNECLVRFLNAKEISDYQNRYYEIMRKDIVPIKSKYQQSDGA